MFSTNRQPGATSTGFGGFGLASQFGQPTFGASTAPTVTFGGSAAFGTSPAFGATQNRPGGFPSNTSVQNNLSALGGSAGLGPTSSGILGRTGSPSQFSSGFGSGAPLGFGAAANTSSAFGKPAGTTSPFGAQTQQQTTSFLGGSTQQSSGFGLGSMSQPTAGGFQQTSGFASPFGQTQQQHSTGLAGVGLSAFGAPGAGVSPSAFGAGGTFGKPAQTTGVLGLGGATSFGVPSSFGIQSVGTGSGPFQPVQISDSVKEGNRSITKTLNLQCISGMKAYENKSPEELRLEDYRKGVTGAGQAGAGMGIGMGFGLGGATQPGGSFFGQTTQTQQQSTPLFGQQATQPTTSFGFGQTQTAATPFGVPAQPTQPSQFSFGKPAAITTGFGGMGGTSSTTPGLGGTLGFGAAGGMGGFGASSTTGTNNLFGAPQAGAVGAFGSTAATTQSPFTSGFGGSSTVTFGASAPTPAPSFGAGTGFGFGTQSSGLQAGTAGTNTGGVGGFGGFGAAASKPATGFGGSMFGQQATQPQQSTPSFGGFGSTSTSAFGSMLTTGALGFGAPRGASTTGGFGTSSFGAGSTTSAFGAAKPATTSGFGGFGSATQQQPAATGFGAAGVGFGSAGFGTAAPAAAGLGGFGAAVKSPSLGGFGQLGQQPQQQTGGFGMGVGGFGSGGFGASAVAPAASGFGSAFGGFSTAAPSLLQQQQPTTAWGQPQSVVPVQPTLQHSLSSKIDSLTKKHDGLDVRLKDDRLLRQGQPGGLTADLSLAGPSLITDSGLSSSQSRGWSSPSMLSSYRHTPRSAAKITPRGYHSEFVDIRGMAVPTPSPSTSLTAVRLVEASPALSTSAAKMLGATTSLSRPDTMLSRRAKRLIIGPQFDAVDATTTPAVASGSASVLSDPNNSNNNQQRNISLGAGTPLGAGASTTSSVSGSGRVGAIAGEESVSGSGEKGQSGFSLGDPTGLTPASRWSPFHHSSIASDDISASGAGMRRTALIPGVNSSEKAKVESLSSTPSTPGVLGLSGAVLSSTPVPGILKPMASKGSGVIVVEDHFNVVEAAEPPIITLVGYETTPSIEILRMMTSAELSKVKNFTVFRPGIGQIEWEGETDVRAINIDRNVKIGRNLVEVYYDESLSKPSVGKGLNKSALVTLFKVLPKEGSSAEKVLKFEDKLREVCAKNDSEFIDYNAVTGNWIFRVKHFSRYGLNDSDDEDEAPLPTPSQNEGQGLSPGAAKGAPTIQEVSRVANFSQLVAADFVKPPNIQLMRAKMLQIRGFQSQTSLSVLSQAATQKKRAYEWKDAAIPVQHETERETDVIVASVSPTPESSMVEFSTTKDALRESLGRHSWRRSDRTLRSPSESPCMQILMRVRENYFRATGTSQSSNIDPIFTKVSANGDRRGFQKKPADFSLFMGRSFRVGWGPNGQILHPGHSISGASAPAATQPTLGKLQIEAVGATSWLADGRACAAYTGMLQALLDHSTLETSEDVGNEMEITVTSSQGPATHAPLWLVPACEPSLPHEYAQFLYFLRDSLDSLRSLEAAVDSPDWIAVKALELVNATLGQEERSLDDPLIPLCELRELCMDVPNLWERRRVAISNWLESVCRPTVVETDTSVDAGAKGQHEDTFRRIFALLSCHRIYDAVALAEAAGLFRLALLIGQADSDENLGVAVQQQLLCWSEANTDSDAYIPSSLLHIYRVLGGLPTRLGPGDKIYPNSTLEKLGWARAVGIFLWYCRAPERGDPVVLVEGGVPLEPFACALLHYDMALSDGDADIPRPRYIDTCRTIEKTSASSSSSVVLTSSQSSSEMYEDSLFSLLTLLLGCEEGPIFEPQMLDSAVVVVDDRRDMAKKRLKAVLSCLSAESTTKDPLDYRVPFFILTVLQCVSFAHCDENGLPLAHICVCRAHMISQLLSAQLWHWAIFLLLQIQDPFQRDFLVKEAMLRYSGFNADSAGFVVDKLNVPSAWLHEASAYNFQSQFNYRKQIEHLNFAGLWRESSEVLSRDFFPSYNLLDSSAANSILEMLEAMKADSIMGSKKSELLLRYLRLKKSVGGRRSEGVIGDESMLVNIYAEAESLLEEISLQSEREKENCSVTPFEVAIHEMSAYLFNLTSRIRNDMKTLKDSDDDRTQRSSKLVLLDSYIREQWEAVNSGLMRSSADAVTASLVRSL